VTPLRLCTGSEGPSEDERYIIQLEVNAHSVNWPIDGGSNNISAFQKYSDVRSWYANHIDRCRFDQLCAVSTHYYGSELRQEIIAE